MRIGVAEGWEELWGLLGQLDVQHPCAFRFEKHWSTWVAVLDKAGSRQIAEVYRSLARLRMGAILWVRESVGCR